MAIKVNSGRVYGGASTRIIPPVTAEDCTIYPAFDLLVLEEHKGGRGCTIRQGRGWARRSVEEIETMCTPLRPVPASVSPDPLVQCQPWVVFGTYFYDVPGEVHLGDAATWPECVVTVKQSVTSWGPVEIGLACANWGMVPAGVWVYVENRYGLRNHDGLGVQVVAAP